jgi:hypothetical protein
MGVDEDIQGGFKENIVGLPVMNFDDQLGAKSTLYRVRVSSMKLLSWFFSSLYGIKKTNVTRFGCSLAQTLSILISTPVTNYVAIFLSVHPGPSSPSPLLLLINY